MKRGASRSSILPFACVLVAAATLLAGCQVDFGSSRDPWRTEAEEKCLAEKGVVASAFIEPAPAIDGPGACGMKYPFRVSALSDGNVTMEPTGRLACPVIRETELWLNDVVQPAALAWLGQPVVAVRQMSAYSCRGMNGDPNAKISEHAFGNALDIGAFRTADGRWITVKDGWKGKAEDRGFLMQVQAGACERFTTVLAPGSNIYHYDHIHVDLMRHAKGRTICKPAPRQLPAAPFAVAGAPIPMPAVSRAPAPPSAPEPAPVYAPMPEPAAIYSPAPVYAPEPPPPPPPPQPTALPASGRTPARPLPPAEVAPAARPSGAPVHRNNGLPPGWEVGPQGVPMSYNSSQNLETGSVKRKYYTVPSAPPSSIPLPRAKAGED